MKLILGERHLDLHAETTWDREIIQALLKHQSVRIISLAAWEPNERNQIRLEFPSQDW